MKKILFVVGAAAALAGGAADAHPRLTSVWPSANAVVSSPDIIRLNFTERLIPKLSHIELTAADGKAVTATGSTVGGDGRQLSIKPRTRLTPGRYTINWTAVSVDTHRVQGQSLFAVK
jgi:methionine-rich copper-binding protein CopC